jgi:hypothetical protein
MKTYISYLEKMYYMNSKNFVKEASVFLNNKFRIDAELSDWEKIDIGHALEVCEHSPCLAFNLLYRSQAKSVGDVKSNIVPSLKNIAERIMYLCSKYCLEIKTETKWKSYVPS